MLILRNKRLSYLIDGINALVKTEQCLGEVKTRWVSLVDVIQNIHVKFKNIAKEKNINFHCSFDCPLLVKGDYPGLEQAFTNVIHNSLMYTRAEGIVETYIKRCNDGVQVAVLDTGIGIQSDEIENIFTPFFRTEEAQKLHVYGKGIGLLIAKMIIENHHGCVRVLSKAGSGTVVIVQLPFE